MSTKDKYYHFPICLLSNISELHDQDSFIDTLNLISLWAYGNAGQQFMDEKREEAGGSFLEPNAPESLTCDLDSECEEQVELAWGAATIGMEIRSYEDSLPSLRRARRLEEEWRAEHGEHLYCRIRKDIFLETRDDYGTLSPRDFLVLCGLYAVIGNAPYKQVSLDRIYYAASGCKSKLVCEKIGRKPTLTRKQVHSALDKLHMRGFFTTVTYRKRFKYFSPRLPQGRLKKILQDHFKKKAKDAAAKRKLSTISTDYNPANRKKKPSVSSEYDDDILDEEPPF